MCVPSDLYTLPPPFTVKTSQRVVKQNVASTKSSHPHGDATGEDSCRTSTTNATLIHGIPEQ